MDPVFTAADRAALTAELTALADEGHPAAAFTARRRRGCPALSGCGCPLARRLIAGDREGYLALAAGRL